MVAVVAAAVVVAAPALGQQLAGVRAAATVRVANTLQIFCYFFSKQVSKRTGAKCARRASASRQ